MQISASIDEDWLLPKTSLKKWEQILCWKEPQCSVKHDMMQHCNGNKVAWFGCEKVVVFVGVVLGCFCFIKCQAP